MTSNFDINEHLEEFSKHCLEWFNLVMYRAPEFADWLSKTIGYLEDSTKQNYRYKIKHR